MIHVLQADGSLRDLREAVSCSRYGEVMVFQNSDGEVVAVIRTGGIAVYGPGTYFSPLDPKGKPLPETLQPD